MIDNLITLYYGENIMSRSVSYPSDAIVCFRDISYLEEDYEFDWLIESL